MIKFENISLAYEDKIVFNNLDLEVKRGEKVILSGKSGIGKSSLFNILLGFSLPLQGVILFEDTLLNGISIWEIRKKIAYIDQDISLGEGYVSELFDFVAGLKNNQHLNFKQEKRDELFAFFELEQELFRKDISELSGGERQRVAIIIALLLERKIFLLDEVTASLDKKLKKKVADFFFAREDWTVLVISHDAVWLDSPIAKIYNLEEKKWQQ